MFGNWIHNKEQLSKKFCEATPFEYVVIDNFFSYDLAEELYNSFPRPHINPDYKWYYYNNPLEKKYALNDFSKDELKIYKTIFDFLQSPETVQHIKDIVCIENLENDPHLHGAGLHLYPNKGKLDMHLDYSIHPISGKERRVNLIYYLNNDWNESWGGDLELRDKNLNEDTKVKIFPKFNSAALFRTCDISFHGIPKPIACPKDEYRKSIAIYYVSDPRENTDKRYKAKYFPLPGQPVNNDLQKLYDIRSHRLITNDDLFEDWENKGNGYW